MKVKRMHKQMEENGFSLFEGETATSPLFAHRGDEDEGKLWVKTILPLFLEKQKLFFVLNYWRWVDGSVGKQGKLTWHNMKFDHISKNKIETWREIVRWNLVNWNRLDTWAHKLCIKIFEGNDYKLWSRIWHVTCNIWIVTFELEYVTYYQCKKTCDIWSMTCWNWLVTTYEVWHVTYKHDLWLVLFDL